MLYFQAVCSRHNFTSNLFIRRSDAIRSAKAHRNRVSRPHNIQILDVWIDNMQVQSAEAI